MASSVKAVEMCICVDCRWVDRCKAYHAVERQHHVAHLNETPDIEPIDPLIHIIIKDLPEGGAGIEWDVRACKSFLKEQGRWMKLRPDEEVPL